MHSEKHGTYIELHGNFSLCIVLTTLSRYRMLMDQKLLVHPFSFLWL